MCILFPFLSSRTVWSRTFFCQAASNYLFYIQGELSVPRTNRTNKLSELFIMFIYADISTVDEEYVIKLVVYAREK